MRRVASLVAMSAAVAWGQAPSDFRTQAEVTTTSKDALHRVTLPFEAYRDTKPDFGDLRIFNAAGEALPLAFTGEPDAVRSELPPVSLPLFPVSAQAQSKVAGNNLDVVVRSNADGTIVSVQGRPASKPAPRKTTIVAWLLDASQVTGSIRALVVDWDVVPGTEFAGVSVDASDDLKSWRRVAQSQLVHLEQGGMKLEQRRVDFGSLRARYLRITGEQAGFALKSVEALREDTVKPAPRVARAFGATPGAKPGEFAFDLGARIPIETVRVVVPPNSVGPFSISTRDGETGPWIPLASATFYRLMHGGGEIESPAIEVSRRSARYVLIQLDPRSPGIGANMPSLEVQWRPGQIVFVARGHGPYTLAFGNREAQRAILALNQLMPDYKQGAEMSIPEDKIVKVTTIIKSESPLRAVVGEVNQRKLVLWLVLLAAVGVLGWMAWRLMRQVK